MLNICNVKFIIEGAFKHLQLYLVFIIFLFCFLNCVSCKNNSNYENALSSISEPNELSVQLIRSFKFGAKDTIDLTILRNKSDKYYLNNENSRLIAILKDSVFFKSDNVIFGGSKRNRFINLTLEEFEDEFAFLYNSLRYLENNFAKAIKYEIITPKKDNYNSNLLIKSKIKTYNENLEGLLGGKMFIKANCKFYIDTAKQNINSFILKYDSNDIIGDGIIQKEFIISPLINDSAFIEKLSNFNSRISKNSVDSFSGNSFIKDLFYEQKISSTIEKFENKYSIINHDESIDLRSLEQDFIILDFMFMKCPGCIKGIPKVNELADDYKDDRIIVLGINPIDRNTASFKDFGLKYKAKYPLFLSDRTLANHFHIKSYPTYVLIENTDTAFSKFYNFNNIIELKEKLNSVL